jgi:hypothetical protein
MAEAAQAAGSARRSTQTKLSGGALPSPSRWNILLFTLCMQSESEKLMSVPHDTAQARKIPGS